VNGPVLVIAPAGAPGLPSTIGAAVVEYATPAEAVEALTGATGPVVLWSDGLPAGSLDEVATAVRAASSPCIEVRGERWAGFTHSPLSGASRGVIAGFGAAGVVAAVDLLASEASSG
jgi:hypothetical protein